MKTVGSLVETARAGGTLPDRHFNPYLHKAMELDGVLLTPSQVSGPGGFDPARFFEPTQTRRPFFVEVGTYMGKNLVEMAMQRPDASVIGLDITYKRTVKTAEKIRTMGLKNAAVGLCDARTFFKTLPACSTDGVCVFFPDPWPKKRHIKNRLVRAPFLEQLEGVLSPDGFLWLKTDSESYFHDALSDAQERGWTLTSEPTPREFGGQDFKTVFETLFERKGERTFGAVMRCSRTGTLTEDGGPPRATMQRTESQ